MSCVSFVSRLGWFCAALAAMVFVSSASLTAGVNGIGERERGESVRIASVWYILRIVA